MKIPLADSPKHWLFGTAHYLRRDPLRWIPEWFRKHGDLVALRVPVIGEVYIAGSPATVRQILVSRASCYQQKSRSYGVLRILMGNGLVTSAGDFWRGQRKLAQPAFHRKKLDAMFDMKVQQVAGTVEELRGVADSGQAVDFVPLLSRLTLDIISRAMFSSDSQGEARDVSKHINTLNEWALRALRHPWMLLLPRNIPLPFMGGMRRSLDTLNRTVHGIIQARRENPQPREDLLGMLLAACEEETGRGMSDEQLRDEVMTMFIAGHETTANAMNWVLYLVSGHPEVEAKLHEEIDTNWPAEGLNSGNIASFSYARQVIEESLRLYPTIWSVGRCATESHELGGYPIAEGTNVIIPIFHFHWSEEYWENPKTFDPSRFEPERRPAADSQVYFPFGAGPRSCIGSHFAMQELVIMAVMLHRHYRFRVEKGFRVEADPLITLRPKYGMRMTVEKRTPAAAPPRKADEPAKQPLAGACPFSGVSG